MGASDGSVTGGHGAGDETPDAVAELRAASTELDECRAAIGEHGVEAVAATASVYEEVAGVLDRYEERATDWDDLEGYAEFRQSLSTAAAELPDAVPEAVESAVEDADDRLVTGAVTETLSTTDFDRARDDLAPAREYADRHEEWREARERYRHARADAATRRRELDDRIEELERLQSLGEADLDAPVERLREPVTAYDDAVADAFAAYRHEADARRLLDLLDAAGDRPLIAVESPPDRLRAYVETHDAGAEPVETLVSYTEFSRSKLSHYVDDPGAFRTAVATNQTYLDRLDATPFQVGWPTPPADRLRFRSRELLPVVRQFAPESASARLRELRDLAGDAEYDRLRESALARAELSAEQRERVQSGAVAADLAAARERRDRIADALAEHPPLGEFDDP